MLVTKCTFDLATRLLKLEINCTWIMSTYIPSEQVEEVQAVIEEITSWDRESWYEFPKTTREFGIAKVEFDKNGTTFTSYSHKHVKIRN